MPDPSGGNESAMSEFLSLLAHLGRIDPRAWDAIIPHGPVIRGSRGDKVSLNPQPLPPVDTFQFEAALVAHEVVGLALEFDARDGGGSGLVGQVTDDWCGTPWPRKWPWPWPGPRPRRGVDGPQPDPWAVNTGRIVAAVVFASYATRLDDGELTTALEAAAEQLAKAAVGQ